MRYQCARGHFHFLNRLLSSFCSIFTRAHGVSCVIPIEARPLPIADVMRASIFSWTVSSLLKTCISARSPSLSKEWKLQRKCYDMQEIRLVSQSMRHCYIENEVLAGDQHNGMAVPMRQLPPESVRTKCHFYSGNSYQDLGRMLRLRPGE